MWNQEDSLSLTMVGVMCLYWEQKTIQEKFMHLFIFHFAKKLFKNLNKKIQTMSENANKIYGESKNFWKKVNVASYIFFLRLIGLWQSSSSPSIRHLNYLIFIITILNSIHQHLRLFEFTGRQWFSQFTERHKSENN